MRTEAGLPLLPLDSTAQYSSILDEGFQIYDPAFGALNTLIFSGGLERVDDLELQKALGGWDGELREHDHELELISLTVRRLLEAMSVGAHRPVGGGGGVVLRGAGGSADVAETVRRLAGDDDFRQAMAELVFVVTDYQEELRQTHQRVVLVADRLGR